MARRTNYYADPAPAASIKPNPNSTEPAAAEAAEPVSAAAPQPPDAPPQAPAPEPVPVITPDEERILALINRALDARLGPADKPAMAELSNPGAVGVDTGKGFDSPKTGGPVRVIAKVGEDPAEAVARVAERHGVNVSDVKPV